MPNYSEMDERLADLIIYSVSINSGYTSNIKPSDNPDLMDQVCVSYWYFLLLAVTAVTYCYLLWSTCVLLLVSNFNNSLASNNDVLAWFMHLFCFSS